jgi:cytochrome c oxidase subunit I+III
MDNYAVRSIPLVTSREPLWDNRALREEVDRGQHYLPGTATGERETIVTSAIDAEPQYLLRLPGPSWLPMLAGVGTAVFFLALTVKLTLVAAAGAIIALVTIFMWLWQTDAAPSGRTYDVGGGVRLPDYMTGVRSHSWWAMVVLMLVDGSIFVCMVFAFLYLWTIAPEAWPPGGMSLPLPSSSLLSAALWLASGIALRFASRAFMATGARRTFDVLMLAAICAMWAGFALNLEALRGAGIRPTAHGYGATAYTLLAWQGLHAALLTLMTTYTLARRWAGLLNPTHRNSFDNTRIMGYYCAVQALVALAVLHAPRVLE